jgi:hypothetical protein
MLPRPDLSNPRKPEAMAILRDVLAAGRLTPTGRAAADRRGGGRRGGGGAAANCQSNPAFSHFGSSPDTKRPKSLENGRPAVNNG